ncbi:MAG: hypothetical protein AAFR67_15760 [Chloroflexota bacterium]
MAVFESFHPDSRVLGAGVLSAVSALGKDMVKDISKKHGIDLNHDYETIMQQVELDILRDLSEVGHFNMVAAGIKIPETAPFPPDINDVHSALASLNMAYQMNVQGENIGAYVYERLGERKAKMTCNNPYPSDFDYGILYGLAKRFQDDSSNNITVTRDDTKVNRKSGGDTCEYIVEW